MELPNCSFSADDLYLAIKELKWAAEKEQVRNLPPVGAMIETPSSVMVIAEIIKLIDFVSIGTNDLTQFMLAADRGVTELAETYSALHPSVIIAIKNVVKAASFRHVPVSVCGEFAGNPETAALLVGLGVRELSMSPKRAARVRHNIRISSVADLRRSAQEALKCRDPDEVFKIVTNIIM